MKLAYWPGCVSRGFTPELHGSMELVAPKLDLELVELDRANCCGAGVIAEHNQELVDTLNARTFAMAQAVDGAAGMMNICSTCQGAQSECQQRLDADAGYREHVNCTSTAEGLSYEHDRRVVEQELPLAAGRGDRPRQAAREGRAPARGPADRPLLRLLHRPPDQAARLRRAPQARPLPRRRSSRRSAREPVEYAGSHKCCGFPVITMNRTTSLRQAGRHLADAIDAGADCLVTPCPLCHLNLDLQQPDAAKFVERDLGMPVLHLPQMVGLALGPRARGARDGQARGRDSGDTAQGRPGDRRLIVRPGARSRSPEHRADLSHFSSAVLSARRYRAHAQPARTHRCGDTRTPCLHRGDCRDRGP